MVTRTASASDVRGVISTDLSDSDINNYIDDAAYTADQEISGYTNKSTEFKTQLEKYYASLLIREWVDRAIDSTSRNTASVTYEGPSLARLRREVDRRDPSGQLAYNRDSSRNIATTG